MLDYEYLFKFIMIGDSSSVSLIQMLARAVFFYVLLKIVSEGSTSQQLVSSLDRELFESMISQLNYKYGTQLVNNRLNQSPQLTTKDLSQHY